MRLDRYSSYAGNRFICLDIGFKARGTALFETRLRLDLRNDDFYSPAAGTVGELSILTARDVIRTQILGIAPCLRMCPLNSRNI